MIDVDLTLFVQFANFVIALVMLNLLLIRPIRRILRQRRELFSGLAHDADDLAYHSGRLTRRYENAMRTARKEGSALCQAARSEAEEQRSAVLEAAGGDAEAFASSSREALDKDLANSRKSLQDEIPSLASAIIAKLTDVPPADQEAPSANEETPREPRKTTRTRSKKTPSETKS